MSSSQVHGEHQHSDGAVNGVTKAAKRMQEPPGAAAMAPSPAKQIPFPPLEAPYSGGAGMSDEHLVVDTIQYNDGTCYTGTLKNRVPDGIGTCVWQDGNEYDGEWRGGVMHGFGTYLWTSGQRYDGEWKDGKREGIGVKLYADGSTFDGFWKDGQKHGVGVFRPALRKPPSAISLSSLPSRRLPPTDQPISPSSATGPPRSTSLQLGPARTRAASAVAGGKVAFISQRGVNPNRTGQQQAGQAVRGPASTPPRRLVDIDEERLPRRHRGTTSDGGGQSSTDEAEAHDGRTSAPSSEPRRVSGGGTHPASSPGQQPQYSLSQPLPAKPSSAAAAQQQQSPVPPGINISQVVPSRTAGGTGLAPGGSTGTPVPAGATPPTHDPPGGAEAASGTAGGTDGPVDTEAAAPSFQQAMHIDVSDLYPDDQSEAVGPSHHQHDPQQEVLVIRAFEHGRLLREDTVDAADLERMLAPLWTKSTHRRVRTRVKQAFGIGRKLKEKHGQLLYKGMPGYNLMAQLQLGVRYSIGKMNQRRPEVVDGPVKLTPSDFKEKAKVFFPADGSSTTPAHPCADFKWKDYAPRVFRSLRAMYGVTEPEYMLALGGSQALYQLNSPGKSGCLFFLSEDERFLIKTMRKSEIHTLIAMLPGLHAHVAAHPQCLISRFYGVHGVKRVHGRIVRFVVMQNLFNSDVHIHKKFDLKGSTFERSANVEDRNSSKVVYKDLDLDISLRLPTSAYETTLAQLRRDAEFLGSEGVMDYSLLLGIHFVARNKETNANAGEGRNGETGGSSPKGHASPQRRLSPQQTPGRVPESVSTPTNASEPPSAVPSQLDSATPSQLLTPPLLSPPSTSDGNGAPRFNVDPPRQHSDGPEDLSPPLVELMSPTRVKDSCMALVAPLPVFPTPSLTGNGPVSGDNVLSSGANNIFHGASLVSLLTGPLTAVGDSPVANTPPPPPPNPSAVDLHPHASLPPQPCRDTSSSVTPRGGRKGSNEAKRQSHQGELMISGGGGGTGGGAGAGLDMPAAAAERLRNFDVYRSNREENERNLSLVQARMREEGYSEQRIADVLNLAKLQVLGQKFRHAGLKKRGRRPALVLQTLNQGKLLQGDSDSNNGSVDGDDPADSRMGGDAPRPPEQLGINVHALAVSKANPTESEEVIVTFGIIDILQEYNVRKLIERGIKSLMHDAAAISVAPPDKYAQRFVSFMHDQTFLDGGQDGGHPSKGGGVHVRIQEE